MTTKENGQAKLAKVYYNDHCEMSNVNGRICLLRGAPCEGDETWDFITVDGLEHPSGEDIKFTVNPRSTNFDGFIWL